MEADPLWNLVVLLHGLGQGLLGAYCKSTAARTPASTSLADAARPPQRESHTPPRRHTRASSTAVAPTSSNRGPSRRHHLARHLNNVLICEPLHRRWLARMIRRRRNVHGLRVDPEHRDDYRECLAHLVFYSDNACTASAPNAERGHTCGQPGQPLKVKARTICLVHHGIATWPRHPRRRLTGADIELPGQLPCAPPSSPAPPCARVPSSQHAQLSTRRAVGAQAGPAPPAGGAQERHHLEPAVAPPAHEYGHAVLVRAACAETNGRIQELSKTRRISEGFHFARRCGRAPKLEQFPNLLLTRLAEP